MASIAVRIALAVALLFGSAAIVGQALGADVIGVVSRLLVWFWLQIVELFARVAGVFSKSLAGWIRLVAQRAAMRRLMQPIWRSLIIVSSLFLIGRNRHDRAERWIGKRQAQFAAYAKAIVNFKPNWPRGLRAALAVMVIGLFVTLFIWISQNIGKWWGLGASVVLWMMVERVQVIGLDALLSLITEKWAPVRSFIGRHPVVRWLWLGPVFDWLAQSLESYKEQHGEIYQGKSIFEVWRRRSHARLKPRKHVRAPAGEATGTAGQQQSRQNGDAGPTKTKDGVPG